MLDVYVLPEPTPLLMSFDTDPLLRPRSDRVESREEKESSDNIIWAINHALVSLLSDDVDHIADSQVGYE